MRPISPAPTGTLATRPVRFAESPSLICSHSPNSAVADVVLLEVEGEARDPVLELEHLQRDGGLEPVDARDPVADLEDGADLGEIGLDRVLLDGCLRGSR